MNKPNLITNQLLKEIKKHIKYNSKSGVFVWIKNRKRNKLIGNEAGRINNIGYRMIGFNGRVYNASRLAWFFINGVKKQNFYIDHIDGNRSNNSIRNLRISNPILNQQNRKKFMKNNRCGYLGVSLLTNGKFLASIKINKKQMNLGSFFTAIEAHKAYLKAKRKYHKGCTI